MNLITKLDDERLKYYVQPKPEKVVDELDIFYYSLCAALESVNYLRDTLEQANAYSESLRSQLAAALRERDEARTQLCRAREILTFVYKEPQPWSGYVNGQPVDAHSDIKNFLSSTAPCPHEEEAKRLREENARMYGCLTGISNDGEDKGADMASRAEHCVEWIDRRRHPETKVGRGGKE